jgi:hypothetical protein
MKRNILLILNSKRPYVLWNVRKEAIFIYSIILLPNTTEWIYLSKLTSCAMPLAAPICWHDDFGPNSQIYRVKEGIRTFYWLCSSHERAFRKPIHLHRRDHRSNILRHRSRLLLIATVCWVYIIYLSGIPFFSLTLELRDNSRCPQIT